MISEKLREKFLTSKMNEQYGLTLSFGITYKHTNDTIENLIDRVDKALYISKSKGKNQSTII